jgi:hypothetical protein
LVSKAVEQARNARAVVDRRAISRACLAQHGAGWSNLSCCLKADYERNALSESPAGAVQAREDQALSSAASEVEKAREQARRESDCGLPNQVRSVRFTALDYQRLTGSWNTIEHTELMVNEYITVALSSPAAPPRDVQLLLESSAAKFPKPTLVAPWWLKNVTTNRHFFRAAGFVSEKTATMFSYSYLDSNSHTLQCSSKPPGVLMHSQLTKHCRQALRVLLRTMGSCQCLSIGRLSM